MKSVLNIKFWACIMQSFIQYTAYKRSLQTELMGIKSMDIAPTVETMDAGVERQGTAFQVGDGCGSVEHSLVQFGQGALAPPFVYIWSLRLHHLFYRLVLPHRASVYILWSSLSFMEGFALLHFGIPHGDDDKLS